METSDSTSGFLWIHVVSLIAGFSQIWGGCEVLSYGAICLRKCSYGKAFPLNSVVLGLFPTFMLVEEMAT